MLKYPRSTNATRTPIIIKITFILFFICCPPFNISSSKKHFHHFSILTFLPTPENIELPSSFPLFVFPTCFRSIKKLMEKCIYSISISLTHLLFFFYTISDNIFRQQATLKGTDFSIPLPLLISLQI